MRGTLILFLSLGASLACNTTEYVILRNKNGTDPGLALRTGNRCEGVRCLYHDDCLPNMMCLRMDNEARSDVEGICSLRLEACSMTVSNIDQSGNLFQNEITMNRCEFVSCHFDIECETGMVCYDRRYCLNKTLADSKI